MSQEEIKDRPLRVCVLTVSDSRTVENDIGGNTVIKFLEEFKHTVVDRMIVIDDYHLICDVISNWLSYGNVDVIITTGGTGIAKRDVTIEAIEHFAEKCIPGFGEIFRYLSYTEDIGTRAIASRATACINGNTVLFATPGSIGAVTLAMTKLIIPEMAHLVREATK